ncbi:MAG: c-type cytochrome [bacterium]|nr:c-type cytochrome [bacterium]
MLRSLLIFVAALIPATLLGQTPSLPTPPLTEQLLQKNSAQLVAMAMERGDARRGALLFHQPQLQCARCHSVSERESPLGPNLAVWDKPVDPLQLVESVLQPSAKIREGYQSVRVLTQDDVVLNGILVSQNAKTVSFRDASGNGQITVIPQDEIAELQLPTQSIMPAGNIDQLASIDQFLDLARYVIEVAQQGPERAAELQPPASLLQLPELPEYEEHIAHAEIIRAWNDESYERGQKIYRRVCMNCHGSLDQEGSLPTSPRFARDKLKNGSDPYRMYQTLTHGYGLMVAQRWMVPQQKYDVIHFIRESFFREHNRELYQELDDTYLDQLPPGDSFGPEPARMDAYVTMNYGPSLNHTYEIELNNSGENVGQDLGRNPRSQNPWANPDEYFSAATAPNYAYKGIAVRLDPGPGGISRGSHWMVYDHDTLNMHAAWSRTDESNAFIDWCCIQFDGQHNVHNRLVGEIHFQNRVGPGWGQPLTGVLDDPRPKGRDGRPYGPLPTAWCEYRGLYHYQNDTILAYRIGSAEILEHPSVQTGDSPIFVRELSIGPATHQLLLRLGPSSLQARIEGDAGAKLRRSDDQLLLEVEPRAESITLRILLSTHPLPDETSETDKTQIDFSTWTAGGPARWPERVTTSLNTVHDDIFTVDELSLPTSNPWNAQLRPTGIDFFADGNSAAMCTWDGDVWIVEGIAQKSGQLQWQRIASGMFQPLGLKIVDGEIYVACRDQITILRDLNGDRETDFYECFNNDHQVTEHFHEFAMGLQRDTEGNFYYAKSARHAKRAVVPHHGTLLKVSPDGKRTEIVATGFRAANGVCLNPDGSFFVTDQEGHWNPKNRINYVTQGGFYGNLYSFTEFLDPADNAMEQPLCWITNDFDRSPAELLWVPEDTWGPLGGSLLNLSYGYGRIYVVPHESINGQLQGGMCPLPIPDFPSGLVRGRFHPTQGDLYVCGMFSWAGSRQAPGCFHRVRYQERPAYLPLKLQARRNTLEIFFSHPLNAEIASQTENYQIRAWDLKRTPNYGSQHYNERQLEVIAAELLDDGRTVVLSVPELAPTWGMSIHYNLTGADGRPFNGQLHNSIYHLQPTD